MGQDTKKRIAKVALSIPESVVNEAKKQVAKGQEACDVLELVRERRPKRQASERRASGDVRRDGSRTRKTGGSIPSEGRAVCEAISRRSRACSRLRRSARCIRETRYHRAYSTRPWRQRA